jgi:hypothetical protein
MGLVTMAKRRATATIVEHKKGPRGGTTRYRFPMPDKERARKALQLLPKAKGLTPEQKARIKARAHRILGTKP